MPRLLPSRPSLRRSSTLVLAPLLLQLSVAQNGSYGEPSGGGQMRAQRIDTHDRERRCLQWSKRRLWPGGHRTGFRCRSIQATITAMSVVAARSPIAKPDVPDLLARARTIASLARERAQQTEVDRRVGEDMIARMRELDLFRIMRPQAYGGFEYGFDVFSDIVAAVSTGCGSTGWGYGLLASHPWLIACPAPQAQDEGWHDRSALAPRRYAPVGQAVGGGRGAPT